MKNKGCIVLVLILLHLSFALSYNRRRVLENIAVICDLNDVVIAVIIVVGIVFDTFGGNFFYICLTLRRIDFINITRLHRFREFSFLCKSSSNGFWGHVVKKVRD